MDGKDMPPSVGDAVLALSLGAKPLPKRFLVTLDEAPGRTVVTDTETVVGLFGGCDLTSTKATDNP